MERRMLLVTALLAVVVISTERASATVYKIDQCERNNFHFSKIRQPCDEFASSSYSNSNAKGECCEVLKKLHDPEWGHIQCYCQLAPSGTGVFGDIAAKCKLQRDLQTCHG